MMIYLSASLRLSNESYIVFVHATPGTRWSSNLNWLFLASRRRSFCSCDATCARNGARPVFQKGTVLSYFGITQIFKLRDTTYRVVPFSATRATKFTYHMGSLQVFDIPGGNFCALAYWTLNGCCEINQKASFSLKVKLDAEIQLAHEGQETRACVICISRSALADFNNLRCEFGSIDGNSIIQLIDHRAPFHQGL